jgi:hypothetical protein
MVLSKNLRVSAKISFIKTLLMNLATKTEYIKKALPPKEKRLCVPEGALS